MKLFVSKCVINIIFLDSVIYDDTDSICDNAHNRPCDLRRGGMYDLLVLIVNT